MKIKVTYLEMFARPERAVPPPREGLAVVHARKPTVAATRALHRGLPPTVHMSSERWSMHRPRTSMPLRLRARRVLRYYNCPRSWLRLLGQAPGLVHDGPADMR